MSSKLTRINRTFALLLTVLSLSLTTLTEAQTPVSPNTTPNPSGTGKTVSPLPGMGGGPVVGGGVGPAKVGPANVVPATSAQSSAGTAAALRVRPNVVANPQCIRATPTINGVLGDTGWTPFYSITTGPIQGAVYCSWDSNYLYIAAQTNAPATLLIDVDASDDGWLRGDDNLELVVGPPTAAAKPLVVARLLDAQSSQDSPVWVTTGMDVTQVQTAGSSTGSSQITEVAIPKAMGSLLLQEGVQLGLRVDFLPAEDPASYQPTAPYEPHLLLSTTLVNARTESVAGITPKLELSDTDCVDGQKLFGTLFLSNQLPKDIPLKTVSWSGLPASADPVDTIVHVNVPDIPASGVLKLGYFTLLPEQLPTGTYTVNVVATLYDGRQVSASTTFNVVEPIHAQFIPTPNPLIVVGNTKLTVGLRITNFIPDHFRGILQLTTIPAGWILNGLQQRSVAVYGKGATDTIPLKFEVPASTQPGDYNIDGKIVWFSRTWDLHCVVHVASNQSPASNTTGGK